MIAAANDGRRVHCVVDAQLHAWEDVPQAHRDPIPGHRAAATAEDHLVAMDRNLIHGALLVQSVQAPPDNAEYLVRMAQSSGRFRVIGLAHTTRGAIDPTASDLAAQLIAWAARPETAGIRVVVLTPHEVQVLRDGYYNDLLDLAQEHAVPVFVFGVEIFDVIQQIAATRPTLKVIIDHLGLSQRPSEEPFADLPGLLELSALENIAVKCTALPVLSREPYPFEDLWPTLHRVIGAYGAERIMWGSDITRGVHTYAESVDYIRRTGQLSDKEKNLILGDALCQLLGWDLASFQATVREKAKG